MSVSELLYSARAPTELDQLRQELLSELRYLHMTETAERLVEEIVSALARRGQHRLPVSDVLLAAIAHAESAVVLDYDADCERIAAVTGQQHEWIVPRGTGHGRFDEGN